MANVVECIGPVTDSLEEQVDPVGGIEKEATKDGLFCFGRVRWQSVKLLEGMVLGVAVQVRLRGDWLVLL